MERPSHVNVSSCYGAPMGRVTTMHPSSDALLCVRKVDFYDGDYDKGGAYWGSGGGPLYEAYGYESEENGGDFVYTFVRAASRVQALCKIRTDYPDVTFKRQ